MVNKFFGKKVFFVFFLVIFLQNFFARDFFYAKNQSLKSKTEFFKNENGKNLFYEENLKISKKNLNSQSKINENKNLKTKEFKIEEENSKINEEKSEIDENFENKIEENESEIESEENSDENAIEESWQILKWNEEAPDAVLFYSIKIEKFDEEKKAFFPYSELRTEKNETELPLRPRLKVGRYRYKIITHNLIGLAEVETEWKALPIFLALKPQISKIQSAVNQTSQLYLEEFNDGIFTIDGKNLFLPKEKIEDGATKNLNEFSQENWTTYALKNKKTGQIYTPEIISSQKEGKTLKIKIDFENLELGEWILLAEDKSGLKSDDERNATISIKFKKPFDFDICVNYDFPVILYDKTFKNYMKKSAWPLSGLAKMTFIFVKKKPGNFGLSVSGKYLFMEYENSAYNISGNLVEGFLDFAFQKPFYKISKKNENQQKKILVLEARAGIGVSSFFKFLFLFSNGAKSEEVNQLNIAIHIATSAQLLLGNRFFLEGSIDFSHAFTPGMPFGQFITSAGFGIKI